MACRNSRAKDHNGFWDLFGETALQDIIPRDKEVREGESFIVGTGDKVGVFMMHKNNVADILS